MDFINYIANIDICNIIYNYLIDKDIIINENDTFINKIQYFLLKYKRIIAIISLIILLIIGNYCNLKFLDINNTNKMNKTSKIVHNNNHNHNHNHILKGGKGGAPKAPPAPKAPEPPKAPEAPKGEAGKKEGEAGKKEGEAGKKDGEPGKFDKAKASASKFASARGDDFKEFAPWMYGILYSVALSIMGCIIILPALGFFVVGIVCYVLLKEKIGYLKSL
jgi:hypothetical protein